MYDAIIVGGGPAGLSAALVLARSRRKVLLLDNGKQRNRASHAMHGFLTRDGIPPHEFLELAQAEVERYGVERQHLTVKNARFVDAVFEVTLETGVQCRSRKLLVATGVSDKLPDIPNVHDFYGVSVHHCPYCDGWEHRDGKLAVYAKKPGAAFALTAWSSDIILFTDGPSRFSKSERDQLQALGVSVRREKIQRLAGSDGRMTGVVLETGETVVRDALFFSTAQSQACDLAMGLGCILNRKGTIETDRLGNVNVPGLFVAGDATHDVQLVIVAAAEGAKAGMAINMALTKEDNERRENRTA